MLPALPRLLGASLLLMAGSLAPAAAEPTAEAAETTGKPAESAPKAAESLPVDDLRLMVEVFHKLKSDYVQELTDKELIKAAIRGLVSGLDPHSTYLDEDAYQALQEGTTGEFGGLGLEVGVEDGVLKVISPIDDTPASRAGIQAGDSIVRLDKAPSRGLSLDEAIKRMRGPAGSAIELTLVREGVDKPIELTLVRDIIKVRSVRSRVLETGYGYLRISSFQAHTGTDFAKQIEKLTSNGSAPLKGVILDLRNNPGGVVGAAVAVADAFLESGRIVYTEGRAADAKVEYEARSPDLLAGAPVVVLVNEGSASASEIVAGALQDRQRALIMGRQTFGKGSVQTIMPMSNNAAIKITTARYFTPNGRSIQAEGIKPDVLLDRVRVAEIGAPETPIAKEAELDRHLANPTKGKTGEKPKGDGEALSLEERAALAKSDYEVFEALNLLKAMALLQARSGAGAGR